MALVEDFDTTIKIIVVGNGGVGKTSMIRRFCTGAYTDTYKKTIGVDFLEKEQYVQSVQQKITFMVWDTAGQEEFNAITKQYYRNANGCIIAFSTVDRDSFAAVERWKGMVEAEVDRIPMVLVQNKVDLIDQAVMTSEEAEALAKRLKLRLYRTCVSENLNIDKVFEYLGEEYVRGPAPPDADPDPPAAAAAAAATRDPPAAAKAGEKPAAAAAAAAAARGGGEDGPAAVLPPPPTPAAAAATAAAAAAKKKEDSKGIVTIEAKPKQRTGGKKRMCTLL